MRSLIIKRRKSFVGSAMKLKVYIEDRECGDLIINETPCSLLGTLKNGEEKSFDIDEQPAKLYVIADFKTRNNNEFYQIYPGYADVYVSGKNYYNPQLGNPFYFDNNNDPASGQIRKEHKQKRKKFTRNVIIAALIGVLFGQAVSWLLGRIPAEPEVFNIQGLSITLTDNFAEIEATDSYWDNVFLSDNVIVLMARYPFDLNESIAGQSIEEFVLAMDYGDDTVTYGPYTDDVLYWYEYETENADTGEPMYFYSFAFKGYDAFWEVQFGTLYDDRDEHIDQIFKWAGSVSFGL